MSSLAATILDLTADAELDLPAGQILSPEQRALIVEDARAYRAAELVAIEQKELSFIADDLGMTVPGVSRFLRSEKVQGVIKDLRVHGKERLLARLNKAAFSNLDALESIRDDDALAAPARVAAAAEVNRLVIEVGKVEAKQESASSSSSVVNVQIVNTLAETDEFGIPKVKSVRIRDIRGTIEGVAEPDSSLESGS